MAEKKIIPTIYQGLNKLLNLDGFGFDNTTPIPPQQTQSKIIIKGQTPEEIHAKGLELEQKREIQKKFFKTSDRSFQKALQYEAGRLQAYMDYESMEYYPLIASALDLFMEEATTIGTNGKMLNIYSNKERIKYLLEEFFYDIVNINVNLPFWTRNVTKYGDNWVLLYGERKKGIIHTKQMVNYEMERIEKFVDGKPIVKFKERMTGDEFNPFEIAHFRLLGDDRFIPYGSCLLSDTYVNLNNGVKQIKDIVKGDIVTSFDIKTQKKIESKVLDVVCNGEKDTYKISTRHNYIKATDNHKILVYDDKNDEFVYKFVSELKINDKLVINTFNEYNEKIKIDKTVEIKEHNGRIYDEFIDDLKYIPDYVNEEFAKLFGFLIGDGFITNKRPFMVTFAYGVHESINKKYIDLLEKFSNKKIYLKKNKIYKNGIGSALVNSKTLANVFTNMGFIGNARTKRIPKWVFSSSYEIREAFLEGLQDADGSVNIDKWNCVRYCFELSNYELINDVKILIQSLGYKSGKIIKRKKREGDVYILTQKIITIADSYELYYYKSKNKQTKCTDIKNRLTNDFIIEKIISITPDKKGFVYDIYVDNENHNFFANNIVVHNSILNRVRRVFRQLCLDKNTDIWTPNGSIKIKDLKIGDEVYSYDYKSDTTIISKIKNVIKTGNKERFKVKTNHREIILTDNHPLLTIDNNNLFSYKDIQNILNEKLILPTIYNGIESFKIKLDSKNYHVLLNKKGKIKVKQFLGDGILFKLKNLNCETSIKNLHGFLSGYNRSIKYDDYIKLMSIFDLTFEDIDLYFFNSRNKAIVDKNLEFNVDNNFIKLFGFMLGDGWTNKTNNVGFALGVYDDENEYYIDLCKNLGGFNYHITNKNNFRGAQVNFYSKELKLIFDKLDFKTGSFNKIIPNWVFSLSYKNRLDFIKGMFDADGCDNNGLYSSSNYQLISSLKMLCETCNLKIGNILKDNRLFSKFKSKNGEIISKRKPSYILYIKLNDNLNYSLKEKILSIENVGVDEVWDIEIDNDLHNFIANGLVVHNCMAEDAMLTYRLVRAGEKKVFKIDVGNIDEDDLEEYMYRVATKFKKTSQVNPSDGQFDYRYNIVGNDEDYFIPVRNANTQTGIDTLPGAQNLSDIADIEFLQNNLLSGLSIPKPFLSFQDAAGGGKNLAQFDIRFSKKVNRIQQAMIQELNKMAMIHLYLLGYSGDDLSNFTLTLTNSSTQQELLKSELMREKATTYKELTGSEGGIAAMSHTSAKRMIFNMSDREIVEDLKQQKMERAIAQELQDAPVIIKKTGLFNDIDAKYGEPIEGLPVSGSTEQQTQLPTNNTGSGGAPMDNSLPMGGETGGVPPTNTEIPNETGGAPAGGNIGAGEMPLAENNNTNNKFISNKLDSLINELVYGSTNDSDVKKELDYKKIITENNDINFNLNSSAQRMIEEIDDLLKNNDIVDNNIEDIDENNNIEIEDIDINDIDENL